MKRKTIALALLTVLTLSDAAYAQRGLGVSNCQWKDSSGASVGSTITFIPPDTPASGGYTCTGGCILVLWGEDEEGHTFIIFHHANCEPGQVTDEGGGVFSQPCKCS